MANVIRKSKYPRDKTYKEMTESERSWWIRTGISPKVSSKDKINIRPKDTLKGTTGKTIDTGAKKVKIISSGPTKGEFRYGGTKDLPPRFSRVELPNAAGDLKDAKAAFAITTKEQKLIQEGKMKQDPKTGKPIYPKKKKKVLSEAISPAIAKVIANKTDTRTPPKIRMTKVTPPKQIERVITGKGPVKPKPIIKSTVKPKPPVVKPKLGTKTPAQNKVRALIRAGKLGADTGPSQAEINKAKAEQKKIKLGTKTPAQDKVKRLQLAQKKGADTGPSDADKAKAKAEQKRINKKAKYGDSKPKPKAPVKPKAPRTVKAPKMPRIPKVITIKTATGTNIKPIKTKDVVKLKNWSKKNPRQPNQTSKAYFEKALKAIGWLVKGGVISSSIGGFFLAMKPGEVAAADDPKAAIKRGEAAARKRVGSSMDYKHGGKIARYNTGTQGKTIRARINRGRIKDTSNGNDFVQNIYDT